MLFIQLFIKTHGSESRGQAKTGNHYWEYLGGPIAVPIPVSVPILMVLVGIGIEIIKTLILIT